MRRILLAFAATLVAASCLAVTLQWDLPVDLSGISGYEVHYGPSSGAYDQIHDVPGETTDSTTVPDQSEGTRYYAVRSRNADASLFSTFSNEVAYTLAQGSTIPLDPSNLHVIYQDAGDDPVATVTRTVAASGGDHTTIQAAFNWFVSNHNFGSDGIARILITDTSTYTFSSAWTIDDSIPGTATSTAYLEITSNASDPFSGPTIEMTHTGGNAGWLLMDNYIYIHNLYFELNTTLASAEVIRINGDYDYTLISRCAFRAINQTSDQDAIYAGVVTITAYVDNTVIWGFGRAGIDAQIYDNQSDTQTWYIDHCSIADSHLSGETHGGGVMAYNAYALPVYNMYVYNTLIYNTSGESASDNYNEYPSGAGTANWTGSNNIAEDASAEAKFTSSYDSVTFTESSPSSGENAWLTEIDTLASLDLDIAGENAYTVTGNGTSREGSEPDSRQDFSTDIMGNARHATTPDIGAFEYTTAPTGGLVSPLAGFGGLAGHGGLAGKHGGLAR